MNKDLLPTDSSESGDIDSSRECPSGITFSGALTVLTQSDADPLFHDAVRVLRKELSLKQNIDDRITRCIDSGCLSVLIAVLKDRSHGNDSSLLVDACWALTNIASGSSQHTQAVVDVSGVEAFLRCLTVDNSEEVISQAMWGLGNVIGDSLKFRDVFSEKALPHILTCASRWFASHLTSISSLSNLSFLLLNMTSGKPKPPRSAFQQIFPLRPRCCGGEIMDQEVTKNCLWIMSNASDGSNDNIEDVLSTGVLDII